MEWIDSHCHLHRAEFDADRAQAIERAKRAGAVALLNPATDFASNRTILELIKTFPHLYGAVGIHPHHAEELNETVVEQLSAWATTPGVVAIGEIGLDYVRAFAPPPIQREALRRQLRLAHELNKPVILHCRGAFEDLMAILKECLRPPIRGVVHCFSGDLATASKLLDLGLMLSFAANVGYPHSESLRSVAKEVPLDQVLLETDAPFLPPPSRRGQRNEPAYLAEMIPMWAEWKGLSLEDVARTTTVNAYHLFGIGPIPVRGKIAYAIRDSLYLNITNACTDRCVFCALSVEEFWKGEGKAPFVKGHHLRLSRDPTVEEILKAVPNPSAYREVVFCGYGEPVIRLAELLEVGRRLKGMGARWIRLNTNGHGNLIHKRSIVPELKEVVDEVSVSLNTPNAKQYMEICRPAFGLATYEAIKQFIRDCRDAGMKVTATVVAMPGVDVEACRRVAEEELKVAYRVRTYDDVG
jgi:TatD DNase family protein